MPAPLGQCFPLSQAAFLVVCWSKIPSISFQTQVSMSKESHQTGFGVFLYPGEEKNWIWNESLSSFFFLSFRCLYQWEWCAHFSLDLVMAINTHSNWSLALGEYSCYKPIRTFDMIVILCTPYSSKCKMIIYHNKCFTFCLPFVCCDVTTYLLISGYLLY